MATVSEGATFTGSNDLRLAADIAGEPEDPPVLFLHGGGQTRHAWGTTARVASRGMAGRDRARPARSRRQRLGSRRRPTGSSASPPTRGDRPLSRPPALVGASSADQLLPAVGETAVDRRRPCSSTSPRASSRGARRIASSCASTSDGFASLDEVADAVAAYNPPPRRPSDLEACRRTCASVRRPLALALGPGFMGGGQRDETAPRSSTASAYSPRRARS